MAEQTTGIPPHRTPGTNTQQFRRVGLQSDPPIGMSGMPNPMRRWAALRLMLRLMRRLRKRATYGTGRRVASRHQRNGAAVLLPRELIRAQARVAEQLVTAVGCVSWRITAYFALEHTHTERWWRRDHLETNRPWTMQAARVVPLLCVVDQIVRLGNGVVLHTPSNPIEPLDLRADEAVPARSHVARRSFDSGAL